MLVPCSTAGELPAPLGQSAAAAAAAAMVVCCHCSGLRWLKRGKGHIAVPVHEDFLSNPIGHLEVGAWCFPVTGVAGHLRYGTASCCTVLLYYAAVLPHANKMPFRSSRTGHRTCVRAERKRETLGGIPRARPVLGDVLRSELQAAAPHTVEVQLAHPAS